MCGVSFAAAPPPGTDSAAARDAGREWRLNGELGASLFLNARSLALEHLVKPNLSLSADTPLSEQFSWGIRASGVLSGTGEYQASGLAGLIRWAPLGYNSAWDPGVSLALGIGLNADILNEDLGAETLVAPYGALAVSSFWTVADRWRIGAVARYAQLSIVELALGVSFSP